MTVSGKWQQSRSIAPSSARPMGVAGTFYERNAEALDRQLDACFKTAAPLWPAAYKAMVVPHAGLAYSGPVAATAYGALDADHAARIARVVVLAPAHRLAFKGLAVSCAGAFDTPHGPVPVDASGVASALAVRGAQINELAFKGEHAIEVELPFIKRLMPQAAIVPILVGDATPDMLDDCLKRLWGGDETLILISSDLSHFLDDDAARTLDAETASMIERLRDDGLEGRHACGHRPLGALLRMARRLDLRPTRLDLRTSGAITGRSDRVVGYGAFGFQPAGRARTPEPLRAGLLKAVRQTLHFAVRNGKAPRVDLGSFAVPLQGFANCFVTLESGGKLRGCVGSYEPYRPLIEDVVGNSFSAGFRDRRFTPLTVEEVDQLALSISRLSHPRQTASNSEEALIGALQPDRDGLILASGAQRALFLPKVWDNLSDPRQFVRALKAKAGLDPEAWPEDMKAFTFQAELIA